MTLAECITIAPDVVQGKKSQRTGALMDFASDRDVRRAILLLRLLAQGEADILAGRRMSQAQVFKALGTAVGCVAWRADHRRHPWACSYRCRLVVHWSDLSLSRR